MYLQAIPNPAANEVIVNYYLSEEFPQGKIEIVDITGRLVYSTDVINSLNRIQINTAEWMPGMYYYSLKAKNCMIEVKPLIIAK